MFTLFIAEKLRLAQLDLVPLGTKRNYEASEEFSKPLSWYVNFLVLSGTKAAGLR